jgi:hypothetical protein
MPASDVPTLTAVSDDELDIAVETGCAPLSAPSSRSSTPGAPKAMPEAPQRWFVSLADRAQHEEFLTKAATLMLQEAVFKVADRDASR